ncbi:hypothetical protein FOZ60_009521 [Perkinsus olseni]|uniref:Uncharacterized protein n=1 Tax=Perkinsus olseni TaxID=32597 RepID=A0A7J6NID6_PEROL|nr:hypothetical protein FOZ60_009521 [Perkinsus olseni]
MIINTHYTFKPSDLYLAPRAYLDVPTVRGERLSAHVCSLMVHRTPTSSTIIIAFNEVLCTFDTHEKLSNNGPYTGHDSKARWLTSVTKSQEAFICMDPVNAKRETMEKLPQAAAQIFTVLPMGVRIDSHLQGS